VILRRIKRIRLPTVITNEDIEKIPKEEKISVIIPK